MGNMGQAAAAIHMLGANGSAHGGSSGRRSGAYSGKASKGGGRGAGPKAGQGSHRTGHRPCLCLPAGCAAEPSAGCPACLALATAPLPGVQSRPWKGNKAYWQTGFS